MKITNRREYGKIDALREKYSRERLFSTAGFALTDFREKILPATFEEQMFLHFNAFMWNMKRLYQRRQDNYAIYYPSEDRSCTTSSKIYKTAHIKKCIQNV